MTAPLILLPPSEGKSGGGSGPAWRRTTTGEGPLAEARAELEEALLAALHDPSVDAADMLRYGSGDVGVRAAETDLLLPTAPTMPAAERYEGVVLEGVGLDDLTPAARRRLDRATWFVSGLWGLVAATDLIPDYRLKFGAKVPGIGIVGTWWKARLQPVVEELATDRLVWNLLTTEHGKVWKPGSAAAAVATVDFTTVERGPRGVSNYHGKLLKGAFVRHLVETDPSDLEAATRFAYEGWKLDPDASDIDGSRPRLVFAASET